MIPCVEDAEDGVSELEIEFVIEDGGNVPFPYEQDGGAETETGETPMEPAPARQSIQGGPLP